MKSPRAEPCPVAKGDRVEVVKGARRGEQGEAFAVFPRVTNPRVMIDAGHGRILSVPMEDVRAIRGAK